LGQTLLLKGPLTVQNPGGEFASPPGTNDRKKRFFFLTLPTTEESLKNFQKVEFIHAPLSEGCSKHNFLA
jgi:hypothetical protein